MTRLTRIFVRLLPLMVVAGLTTGLQGQAKAAYGQQLFLLKSLKPSAKVVGVIGAGLSDAEVQSLTRAGLGLGLSVVVARPANARDVAVLYKRLVGENKIDLLLITPGGGDWFAGASVEYLRENSVLDRVGLCVPAMDQLSGGALCTVQNENGKLVVHVNQKVAHVVGATVPGEQNGSIAYVVR